MFLGVVSYLLLVVVCFVYAGGGVCVVLFCYVSLGGYGRKPRSGRMTCCRLDAIMVTAVFCVGVLTVLGAGC